MLTTLTLDAITIEPDFQVRPLHQDVVDHYADIFAELPPITVFCIDNVYVVAAGHHRLAAATRLDLETIDVELRDGTREEAIVFALTSNAKHGLPLSKEEERQVILRLARLYKVQFDDRRIEPFGVAARIGRGVSRSPSFVDTMLRAHFVGQAVPIAGLLQPTKLEEISRAPQETWEPLISAAYHGHWDYKETSRRVHDVNTGKPLDEVIERPAPQYFPPPKPDDPPEKKYLLDYMELNRQLVHIAPYMQVGRYDWREVRRDEAGVMLMQLGLLRIQIEKIMAFLLGEGFEPAAPDAENTALQEVYAQ